MPTQAISAFGVQFRLGNAVALPALMLTNAVSGVGGHILVTTAVPHGILDLSYGTITGVTGTTNANGAWVVERMDATTLKLRHSLFNAAYISGGTLTLNSSYFLVAEVTNIEDLGGTATLVDVTAHDAASRWGSRIPTFLASGNMRISLNHVPADTTQTQMYTIFENRVRVPVMFVLPDVGQTVWYMVATVTGWNEQAPVGGALTAQVNLESVGDLAMVPA